MVKELGAQWVQREAKGKEPELADAGPRGDVAGHIALGDFINCGFSWESWASSAFVSRAAWSPTNQNAIGKCRAMKMKDLLSCTRAFQHLRVGCVHKLPIRCGTRA